jgi:hypothetical protein
LSEDEFKLFLKRKAKEILDMSVDRVLDEAADKVMAEKEGEPVQRMEEEEKEVGDGMLVDASVPDGEQGLGARANSKEKGVDEGVAEAALIPELNVNVRSSPRLAGAKNEHTLVKAGERMARRNLELGEGMPSSTSDFSLSTTAAASNLQQLGFLVGSEEMEITNKIKHLLFLESDRGDIGMSGSDREFYCSDSEEETMESLEANALKTLYGDLMEEIFDEDFLPLNSELTGDGRKHRSHAKSCLNRTCEERKRIKTARNRRK